jgi:GTP-binding protein HflX
MLILDIFAKHAKSGEGKLQVELAQLKYSAPRLVGKGKELSRQGGGIGSRGPGETKLETDRRHLKERIATLEARLSELEHTRAIMRAQRDRSRIPKVALVGYTNAGKSTLLNAITDAGVLCEDKLFATLDPTTRKAALPSGESILLTDTVGFIRKLPHQLVKAFKSTLDEVRYADILLVTVDSSDPELLEHIAVTEEVITELSASEKPRIYVYNKADLSDNSILRSGERSVAVSARTGAGIEELMLLIERIIKESKREVELIIPYSVQSAVSDIYNEYTVLSCEYIDTGARIRVVLDERGLGLYKKFIVE